MGYYLAVGFVMIAVALQNSALPALRATIAEALQQVVIFGVPLTVGLRFDDAQPDLVLLIVLAWAVHSTWEEAYWWAVVGGILQDIVTITPTGTSPIALLIVVTAIRFIDDNVFDFNIILLLLATAIGTILHHAIVVGMVALTIGAPDIMLTIQAIVLPALLFNLVLMLPTYWILRRIQKRLPTPQPSPWSINNT